MSGLIVALSVSVARTSFAQAPVPPAAEPATEPKAPAVASDDDSESTELEVTLPELLEAAPPEYPAAAREARLQTTVVLRLTIDTEGRVAAAEVVEPRGYGFDEAALAAARTFRFAPARRGDRPVAARILYETQFRLEPEPAVAGPSPSRVGTAPAPAAAPKSVSAEAGEPLEVTVHGLSVSDRLRQSAEAVQVVETERAARESADLGEVLARVQGVGVRRAGGLGSETRFSLNGLTDDQVRFFIDEVPLEFTGFGLGIANVPVGLLERVEIYRGVVPIRFGADALGGAVNLVTPQDYRKTAAGASYQVGSFGTYRLTLMGRQHAANGLVVGASAFADHALNDYEIEPDNMPNRDGRHEPASVRRFHDRYRAIGANIEAGVVDRPWAQRLLLKLFGTGYTQEIQHNAVMTVPYGEVESGEVSWGGTLRYHQSDVFVPGLRLGMLGAITRREIDLLDASLWSYDWYGHRVRERMQDIGELGQERSDTTEREWRGLVRSNIAYPLGESHELRLNLSFTRASRSGENRLFDSSAGRDPRNVDRGLTTLVSGLEYQVDLLERALENILFFKDYFYRATGETTYARVFTPVERETRTQGAGNAVRYRFADWSWAKASYEYATRLPDPDEVFGDGVLVAPNPELEPETSHNVNLGVEFDAKDTSAGELRGELTGFLRVARNLIVLLPADANHSINLNVLAARSQGIEGAAGWTSPGEYLWLDGNVTWLDFRNVSKEGAFADFEGDRVPNRPWLTANTAVRLQVSGLTIPGDEVSLGWNTRYVQDFYRGWESTGDPKYKQTVDSQLLHSLVLTYLVRSAIVVASSLEVDNLTDAKASDFYGVQKPGRAVSFKGSLEY